LPLKSFISGRAIFEKSIFETAEALFPDVLYVCFVKRIKEIIDYRMTKRLVEEPL